MDDRNQLSTGRRSIGREAWGAGVSPGLTRRVLLGAAAAGAATTGVAASDDLARSGGTGAAARCFVLVHNGFAGGWVWAEVARRLRRAGHEVFTPTLTGLGERAHLARPDVDLATHVQDVVGVLECEALSRVVLVGSSSGAMVVAGVAQRVPERLARLVYVDTIEPADGQSWFDLITPAVAQPLQASADQHGQGWRVPRQDVAPPRWVPHPLRTVTQPLAVRDPRAARLPRSYVHATAKPAGWFLGLGDVIDRYAATVRASSWDFHRIDADHLPQLSQPAALAEILGRVPA